MKLLDAILADAILSGPATTITASFSRADLGMPQFFTADAYHPTDRGSSAGHTHITSNQDYQLGRIKRDAYAPLCTGRKYWGMMRADRQPSCPKCQEIAARHNVNYVDDVLLWQDERYGMNDYMAIG